jgi:hypothetical protein
VLRRSAGSLLNEARRNAEPASLSWGGGALDDALRAAHARQGCSGDWCHLNVSAHYPRCGQQALAVHASFKADTVWWAYYFVSNTTAGGLQIKCLPVVDEYTRECWVIDVAGSIRSKRVIEALFMLVSINGALLFTRSDTVVSVAIQ